jgi:hypothetical protein
MLNIQGKMLSRGAAAYRSTLSDKLGTWAPSGVLQYACCGVLREFDISHLRASNPGCNAADRGKSSNIARLAVKFPCSSS